MPIDLVKQERRQLRSGKPTCARGRVVEGPNGDDRILVQLIGWSAHYAYEIPKTNWMPRPNQQLDTALGAGPPLVPKKGDTCLVVFDHLGDGWVPVWGGPGAP